MPHNALSSLLAAPSTPSPASSPPASPPSAATREDWLRAAVAQLRPAFLAQARPVPAVQVSIGFPSVGALARRRRRIGECWPPQASRDGLHHLFLSPLIAEPVEILATLVHELVHVAVGTPAGHGPLFRRLALALGLEGRMRETVAGPDLRLRLAGLAAALGAFPHAGLLADPGRRKQGTRLLKIACPACGYTARTTAKWAALGLPVCP
jgi:hypothetical protein